MEKIEEREISGAYEGKRQDVVLRNKLNEIIEWINELEEPVEVKKEESEKEKENEEDTGEIENSGNGLGHNDLP